MLSTPDTAGACMTSYFRPSWSCSWNNVPHVSLDMFLCDPSHIKPLWRCDPDDVWSLLLSPHNHVQCDKSPVAARDLLLGSNWQRRADWRWDNSLYQGLHWLLFQCCKSMLTVSIPIEFHPLPCEYMETLHHFWELLNFSGCREISHSHHQLRIWLQPSWGDDVTQVFLTKQTFNFSPHCSMNLSVADVLPRCENTLAHNQYMWHSNRNQHIMQCFGNNRHLNIILWINFRG